jgi:mannose/cellobiose epimerase-like protein (N-acyl-D-glucosamine 2-epimerase family)
MADLTALTGDTLWEHYDEAWMPDLDYNRETPRDLFRPFGVLPGHLLEWTKLLSQLDRARPLPWTPPVARRCFAQALSHGWDREHGGFMYAYGLDGTVVDDAKYHWVIAEAIGAAAMLAEREADQMYGRWYDRFWAYAMRHQVDRERGGWYPTLTRENRRLELSFTRGKSDFYHPLGAILLALSLAETRHSRGDEGAP